jgi:D-alanyl-lipoteichoic acid acyltransferase DltB (MBOAT superfamily)
MLLGGLWHGAAWNFVIWGAFHGAILMLYRALAPVHHERPGLGRWLESGSGTLFRWAVMSFLTLFGWLLFRAHSAEQILYFIQNVSLVPGTHSSEFIQALFFYSWPLLVMEPIQHWTKDLLAPTRLPWPLLAGMYAVMVFLTLGFGNLSASEFIYFQF